MENTSKKRSSCLKAIAIIVAAFAAAAAVAFVVYKLLQKKNKSEVLGAVDIDGDGEADAIMLDTTGDGEVDTIVFNVEPSEETCED